jgi:hypothetical protein
LRSIPENVLCIPHEPVNSARHRLAV